MNIPLETAKALTAEIEKAGALCHESLRVVKSNEKLGILQVYGKLVGLFLGHSYTNILAPLWKAYPELEPESMKQPYEEPVPSLSPESQAAIAAFLSVAGPALEKAAGAFSSSPDFLPFGGIDEVTRSVAAIEEFLQNPRFRDPVPPAPGEP